MDNQNNPLQPQDDNSTYGSDEQSADAASIQNNDAGDNVDGLEAARRAVEEAQAQNQATSPQQSSDNVQSFQIPTDPQPSTPQAETFHPEESAQTPPTPAPQPDSQHSIQNFKRKRAPGDEQTTRMPPGPQPIQGANDLSGEPVQSDAPPRQSKSGSMNRTHLQPIEGETELGPQPQDVPDTTNQSEENQFQQPPAPPQAGETLMQEQVDSQTPPEPTTQTPIENTPDQSQIDTTPSAVPTEEAQEVYQPSEPEPANEPPSQPPAPTPEEQQHVDTPLQAPDPMPEPTTPAEPVPAPAPDPTNEPLQPQAPPQTEPTPQPEPSSEPQNPPQLEQTNQQLDTESQSSYQPSTEENWHIQPAFSEGVIGVGDSSSEPVDSTQQQPPAATDTPVQGDAPTQPVPQPQSDPAPAGATTPDTKSFQIPQPAPQATEATPTTPTQQPDTTASTAASTPAPAPTEQPTEGKDTEAEAPSTESSKKKFTSKFDKIKSFNYKPFVSAGLMGIAVFALFNSQVILGQMQYITTPSGGVETTGSLGSSTVAGDEDKIIIPKINVDVPVVYDIKTFDEDAVQEGLERGVVHYGTTAMPGEIGNNVIVGHSSNNWWDSGEYKFAFILLDRLDDGDEIILHYNGTRYVYEVERNFVVEPTDVSVLEQGDDSIITLITCTPPGTSWQRLIVQAKQVTPDPSQNVERGAEVQTPDELPSDLPRDNTGGFTDFVRGLFQ